MPESQAVWACRSAGVSPVRLLGAELLGGRQAGLRRLVDEQAPHALEGDGADELLDVDAAVAERAALAVGLGDLRLDRDDAFEPRLEVAHRAEPEGVPTG